MSAKAKQVWIDFHDAIEKELGVAGDFGNVADFAAKTAENAARIAALFHVYGQGPSGEVSRDEMKHAAAIAAWHLLEARRIINATSVPEAIADALLLLEWIVKLNKHEVPPRDILRCGPNKLRDKRRRNAALGLLFETSNLAELKVNGTTTLVLNPALQRRQ